MKYIVIGDKEILEIIVDECGRNQSLSHDNCQICGGGFVSLMQWLIDQGIAKPQ